MHPDYILTSAGVIVALAFFVLRGSLRLAAGRAVTAVAGELPAVLCALNGGRG